MPCICRLTNIPDLVFSIVVPVSMKRAGILTFVLLLVTATGRAQADGAGTLPTLTDHAFRCYLNDPDSAIALTKAALEGALRMQDTFYEGYCYFVFAKAYWVKANYKLSTEYGFKALKIFEDSPHYAQLSKTKIALARNLVELGNIPKARNFLSEALRAGIRHNDAVIQAAAYRELSYLLTEVGDLDSALAYSDKAIALFRAMGDSLDISVLYGRKSRIYFQQGQFGPSRDYAWRGLLIDSLVGNRRGLGISYYQVAQNEHALGNLDQAVGYLQKSIKISSDIGNLTWQIKAYELLAVLYLEAQRHALAAEALQNVSRFKDELYNSEKNGQIQEMQSLHELEAKEHIITMLEQENVLKHQQVKNQRLFVAFLLVAVLFLLLLAFALTRMRTMQQKANKVLESRNTEIEQQKIEIQTQAENLRQLDQIKTKLFSVISHDLRGPIANLQSLLELFTKKLMTADEFVNLSCKLRDSLNATQRTLENLLTWSLSQMGGIRTNRIRLDVAECINEACALMSEVAARKNITLMKYWDASLKVWADQDQLQVVLRNLIHNAIKFSPYNETIEVRATIEDQYCQISVKDSGIGMTQEEIEAVVDSKQYLSKTGTEQEKGTGLGLLLCKEFITRNGGKIGIKSTVGSGTEVSFSLLLAEQRSAQPLAMPG